MNALACLAGVPFRIRWGRERLERFRDARFRRIVRLAARDIPFYRELLRVHHVDPSTVRCVADIGRLPIVFRDALRDAGQDAWSRRRSRPNRRLLSTSGSSGTPLYVPAALGDLVLWHGINLHCHWRNGWRPWHRGLALGSTALPYGTRIQRLGICRWDRIDTTRPVEEWIRHYERCRPQAFHCYPSALREFCVAAMARGGVSWQPRCLTVGGELFTEDLASLAQRVFAQRPAVFYGAMEAGRMAFECDRRSGSHVRMDCLAIEILDDDGRPVAEGPGQVHVTALTYEQAPIIRYSLGDIARWEQGDCPCGLWWPRIVLEQGRVGDVVALPGGRCVPVTTLAARVAESCWIRQFQFVQATCDEIVIRCVVQPDAPMDPEVPVRRVRDLLPDSMAVRLEIVDSIPRTAGGKVPRLLRHNP